ncbi:MAG: hypothetical protein Q9163_003620 [Psora crenata]
MAPTRNPSAVFFVGAAGSGLKVGFYCIDIPGRKAQIYDDGSNAVTTTTVPASRPRHRRSTKLPVHMPSPSPSSLPSLSDYKNKFVYMTSFSLSQIGMLAAAQRATNTQMTDWTVTHIPVGQVSKGESPVKRIEFVVISIL